MTDSMLIADLADGEDFVGFYVLKRASLLEYEGGVRLEVELSDSSGAVPGVVWENARETAADLVKGGVVKVKGQRGTWRDRPQITVERIRPAADGEYDPDGFLPVTPCDRADLVKRLTGMVESVTDPFLRQLADSIFTNEQFMADFSRAPGGKLWHHVYLGGLLEHSVGVAELCRAVADMHPELNRDLLLVAALLHDAGKIREYRADTIIDYSDEGRLEGHIVMGDRFVRNMCDRIEGFPAHLRMLLSHLMLSHQGHKEFSTPVEPMIPEAFVLYFTDEIDSKLNACNRIIGRAHVEGEHWSEYVKVLDRFLYAQRPDLDG